MAKAPSIKFFVGRHSITQIVERVLVPLRRYGKYEEFHPRLISYLWKGLIQNARGIEVLLKWDGMRRFDANYCDQVSFLCDGLMGDLDRDWRSRYYKIELDRILVTLEESAESQRQPMVAADQSELLGQEYDFNNMLVQASDSSAFVSPGTTVFTPESPLDRVALPFTTSPNGTDFLARHFLANFRAGYPIEPLTTPSFHVPQNTSFSAPSPGPAARSLSCDLCDRDFKGLRDAKSNLKRHTRHIHDGIRDRVCEVSGCGEKFARPDYLRTHYERDHNHAIRRITRRRKRKPDNS